MRLSIWSDRLRPALRLVSYLRLIMSCTPHVLRYGHRCLVWALICCIVGVEPAASARAGPPAISGYACWESGQLWPFWRGYACCNPVKSGLDADRLDMAPEATLSARHPDILRQSWGRMPATIRTKLGVYRPVEHRTLWSFSVFGSTSLSSHCQGSCKSPYGADKKEKWIRR